MVLDHLSDLRAKEESYWWHVSKRQIVLSLLSKHAGQAGGKLLEIGCGGGFLSSLLTEQGWQVVSSDVCFEAAGFSRQRGVRRVLLFDASRPWPFQSGSFRAVCMLDVLEHLADDRLALSELRRVIAPGGVAVLTVPAHPFLYSGWDRMLGHHRRYTLNSIRHLVRDCGLDMPELSYWNAISLPPAILLRCLRSQEDGAVAAKEFPKVPAWVNSLLRCYGTVESWAIRRIGVPAGLSLVSVMRKS